jgi:hypothetical protein
LAAAVGRSSSSFHNEEWIRIPIPKNIIPPPDNGTAGWNLTEWDSAPIGRSAFLMKTGWNSPPVFRVLYDPNTMHRVSESSGCEWAVNGGPYQTDGTPVGVVIANGTIVAGGDDHTDDTTNSVGFGITRDGNYYILGNINAKRRRRDDNDDNGIAINEDDDNIIDDLQEFVTGFDWLVYNGTAQVGNDTTGAVRAPRTAIGVDGHGRLLWFVVDGCEVWYVT